ncbi:TPA: hypothetical protein H1005_00555 [archaeon]|uniref:Uncharacterized protein n=1 Tax=Candidatus Naiadarchaeum limnaeum TaxID=2756139 RepID=A0A832VA20_9ARCH|nr:hypothetical protein [Candidatus Naiadarchaeales archaeon SRR2090153.bin1042]HIK00331.1 hypothetical protein [Candidatus Naiadarchaeum limnaeum]
MNNRGYVLKLAAFAIAFILIGYGYYGLFYIPQNSGFGGSKCILENFQAQQTYKTGEPCVYSFESLAVGIILVILIIVIWWKFD